MKQRLTSYTFDASAQTVTAGQFSDVTLAGIQLIVNVTDQVIIYNFADSSKGGTLSTDTLTLEYDTTTMDDADELMILVEDGIQSMAVTSSTLATSAKQDTIIGHIDGIETLLTAIDGRVDGVEALLTTIDTDTSNISTKIDTIAGAVAGSEMQVDIVTSVLPSGAATSAKQDTIIGHVDGIETLIGTTNTTLTTIDGRVDGIEALLTTIDGRVDGLETSNSAIQTAVELLDDTVGTLGTTTYTEATSKGLLIGAVRRDADTPLANTTNEYSPLITDANGYLKVEVFSGATLPVNVASGGIASGAIASGAIASGAVASGAIASGAIASGAIAAGAIAAGATSIATTEDTASAAADHLVKIAQIRLDTPVANANVSNDGDYTQFIADNFGKLWVAGTVPEDVAHIAGESITRSGVRRIDTPATSSGTSGDWSTMDASAEGALWTTLTPTTTGGVSTFKTLDLDETEEEVKATAGNVYGYYFFNAATSTRYLKWYNATAANVTVGTTTPVRTYPLPAGVAGHISLSYPLGFSTAITVAVTTGLADNNTGAPGANEVQLNVDYK